MSNNSDGIYTRKDRPGYWMHWTDAQGRRKWRKLNVATLQQARKARAAELVRVEQSRVLGFSAPGDDTVADVATRFLAHQKARLTPKAYDREKGIVNEHLVKFFTGTLSSIRRVDVQRYVTKRAGEVSAHSVQKELNILKHLLRVAVEWEVLPFTVAHGIKCPRVPAGRVRYLQPGELRSVLESSPAWLRPIVALAACTGMRRSEVLGLRWLSVDLANSRVLLSQTKNGEGRIVYLNETAKAAVRSRIALLTAILVAGKLADPQRAKWVEDTVAKRDRHASHRSVKQSTRMTALHGWTQHVPTDEQSCGNSPGTSTKRQAESSGAITFGTARNLRDVLV